MAANYPLIRLFTASLVSSAVAVDELLGVEQPWSVAGPNSVNGGSWKYFSATCWFYGRNIFDSLKYPIGLIDTDWGGTPVEAWSSPDALAKCKTDQKDKRFFKDAASHQRFFSKGHGAPGPNPHTPSVLWNAMIYPFLNMTIKGAVWYQGEANAGSSNYNCTFPAMIDDWREKWYTYSMKQTDPLMGFGFVQLAANGADNKTVDGFPVIRWAQTANYGYVPNDRLKNVFMAVAMDLGDPTSPFGSVHPRDKQDVGARLALSARKVIYGENIADFQGPLPSSATVKTSPSTEVTVSFQAVGELDLRYPYGFELSCGANGTWIEGTASKVMGSSVTVGFPECPAGSTPDMVRYCWRTDPCTFKMCPIYAKESELPAAPFEMSLSSP